jgi:malate dehydrogenase (oxaloacetate-decarboxylating)
MSTKEELLAKAKKPIAEAMRLHPFYKGKWQMALNCPVRSLKDFSVWYTPGVAEPCRDIQANPDKVWEHTGRGNRVAIVTDGTRVLGLGDIGPEAAMPVMEGKALLFKYLGGVDAVPVCLDTKDPDEIVRACALLAPSFGGINLEDISQPKCFEVLERVRAALDIPVWHDDQQGTGTVVVAALDNALKVVGKDKRDVRIGMIGAGAANMAAYNLLRAWGVAGEQIVMCDSRGPLHAGRDDIERDLPRQSQKWRVCTESNPARVDGGVRDTLRGADVCLAFSSPRPGVVDPAWIEEMAKDPIVFACANPSPEVWPWDALEAGARVVGTGRGDFPNQVNNSLAFPSIFRGALDVRATTISDSMALAAADALARYVEEGGLSPERIVPRMDEPEVYLRVAVAVGRQAQDEGIARVARSDDELLASARTMIERAQRGTEVWMREGIIPPAPPADP